MLALAERVGISTARREPCALATTSSRILKPCTESFGANCSETIAANHEEAAHGIGDFDPQHLLGHFGGKRAGAGALLC